MPPFALSKQYKANTKLNLNVDQIIFGEHKTYQCSKDT